MINLTPIALMAIALCVTVISVKLTPWIKANISKAELEEASLWAEIAVNAAEKLVDKGVIDKQGKYEYVEKFLESKGYHLNMKDIEVLLEGYVNKLPQWLDGIADSIEYQNIEKTE